MRQNIVMLGLVLVISSCQKEKEPVTTRVQIKSIDFITGDTLPGVAFEIVRSNDVSRVVLGDTTNDYGNYNGSFVQEGDEYFAVRVEEKDYYHVNPETLLTPDETNVMELRVIPLGTIQYTFDCSGPGDGYIGTISRHMLHPLPSEVAYLPEGLPATSYGGVCETSSNADEVFHGEWIISYEWQPTVGVGWITLTDTITVSPGQDYVYPIVY